jgi:hypothetical protein
LFVDRLNLPRPLSRGSARGRPPVRRIVRNSRALASDADPGAWKRQSVKIVNTFIEI